MARASVVTVTDSDVRYFKIDPGYRYGIYLERDKPAPQNRRVNLCLYRVPEGMQAPVGRLSPDVLAQLALADLTETEPDVIARFPYWSLAPTGGTEVPDDTAFEETVTLPASLKDAAGNAVEPPDAFTPLTSAKTAAKPAKAEKPTLEPAAKE